jgi:hypothetical protein
MPEKQEELCLVGIVIEATGCTLQGLNTSRDEILFPNVQHGFGFNIAPNSVGIGMLTQGSAVDH